MQKLLSIDESRKGHVQNAFDVPREIGCYSQDAQKRVHYDRSQMKYYIPRDNKDLHLDLNVGYESSLREPYNSLQNFHRFLKVIADSHLEELDGVDFVTSRGTIQALLCTPYCPREDDHWMICACRIEDVIYFIRIDTDAKINRESNATKQQKRMSAWGYKFEQYMTADDPKGVPDISSNTHEIEKYHTVITNRIGAHDLLMCAEVDGVHPSKICRLLKGDPSCYVEMKTSKIQENFRSTYFFKKYKSLKWWTQSVIVGIDENVCGLRDDSGIVRFISNFKTKELPFMCQNNWNSDICFNFCNNFLKYLIWRVKNNPRIVYKFEYFGGSEVFISVLRDPKERYQVIPDSFLAELQRHERNKKT